MRTLRLATLLIIVVALLATVLPAFAEPDAEIISVTFDEETCLLTVVFAVADPSTYFAAVWDNGDLEAVAGGTYGGMEVTVVFNVGPIEADLDIGIYIQSDNTADAATEYDDIDPYEFPNNNCAELNPSWSVASVTASVSAECPYPLPAGSVVYNLPAGAPAFWAADLSTQTTFNIPSGTWYVSEFTGDFAKVWIACQARPVWVPANAVSQ